MPQVRRSEERGLGRHGWLESRHTFSFAEYFDPQYLGFRSLRVINEDRIAGGTGFDTHPHRDMEIITYVIQGALEHEDSMGVRAVLHPGQVQRISCGDGIEHSERNGLKNQETHFFQIWITPREPGGSPSYAQRSFEADLGTKSLVLVISEEGRDRSLDIKQDADIYISRLYADQSVNFKIRPERGVWLQVISGRLKVGDTEIAAGDALSFENEEDLEIRAADFSEFFLFDLA